MDSTLTLRIALAAFVFALIAAVVIVVIALSDREGGVSLLQRGDTTPIHVATCKYPGGRLPPDCGDIPVPRQTRTRMFDPSRAFRLRFPATGLAIMTAGRMNGGRFRRLGSWEDRVQCIDTDCVDALEFPPTEPRANPDAIPPEADTLQLVVFGDKRILVGAIELGLPRPR